MRIASQNIEFLFDEGSHTHSGETWNYTPKLVQDRIDYFARLFREIDADILLLQEIASRSVIERIVAAVGIDYASFFATPDQNGVGNVVLYKHKDAMGISVPALSPLPVFVEGDADVIGQRMWSRRDFVHLQTTFGSRPLHVIDLHIKANFLVAQKDGAGKAAQIETQIASADGLIRSELFRFSQAKRVRTLIDEIFASDPDAQIVVGGDFNAEERDSVFRIIRGVMKDAPDLLATTTPKVAAENRYTIPIKDRPSVIDHLLVSRSLEPRVGDVRILNEYISANTNVAPDPNLVGSDHAPIILELNEHD